MGRSVTSRRRYAALLLVLAFTVGVLPGPVSAADPLDMQSVLDLAEWNSAALAQARLQVVAARQSLEAARNQDPGGSVALGAVLEVLLGTPVTPTPVTVQRSVRQAEVQLAAEAARLSAARQQVRADAARAYVEWQKAVALGTAQAAQRERLRSQVAAVQAALKAGTAAAADLTQINSQFAAQEAAVAGAAAQEAAAFAALERAAGIMLPAGIRPAADLPDPAVPGADAAPEAELVSRALAARPDLRMARLQLENQRVNAALLAEQAADGPALATARQQVQQAALQLAATAADVEKQVRQAAAGAAGARQQLAARIAAAGAAALAHRLATLRQSAGVATSLDVQAALANLAQAETERVRAAADLALALVNLSQALGEL